MPASVLAPLSTAWALFQGLLLEALPFLLLGVLIAAMARWLNPGGSWLQRLPGHPLGGPLVGAALGYVAGRSRSGADRAGLGSRPDP